MKWLKATSQKRNFYSDLEEVSRRRSKNTQNSFLPSLLHIFRLISSSEGPKDAVRSTKICSRSSLLGYFWIFFQFYFSCWSSSSLLHLIFMLLLCVCASAYFFLAGRLINYQRTDKRISYPKISDDRLYRSQFFFGNFSFFLAFDLI